MSLVDESPHRRSGATVARRLQHKTASVTRWMRLPGLATPPECASIRYWEHCTGRSPIGDDDRRERSPVLLVHGYAGTEHTWAPLRQALTAAGFGCLVALRYNAFRADIHHIADWLVDQARRSMQATGTDSVHLVGHSLGGLVVRDAVQRRGLAGAARTAVTIATPHAGARLARFVPGPAARQMRPGSDFLAKLRGDGMPNDGTTWITIDGAADRVVPHASSILDLESANIEAMRQPAAGHGAVARHPAVVSYIVRELQRAEQPARKSFSFAA